MFRARACRAPRNLLPLPHPQPATFETLSGFHFKDYIGWTGGQARKQAQSPEREFASSLPALRAVSSGPKHPDGVWEQAEPVGPHQDPSSAKAPRVASCRVAEPGDQLPLPVEHKPEPRTTPRPQHDSPHLLDDCSTGKLYFGSGRLRLAAPARPAKFQPSRT